MLDRVGYTVGLMHSDRETPRDVAPDLGLLNSRHIESLDAQAHIPATSNLTAKARAPDPL